MYSTAKVAPRLNLITSDHRALVWTEVVEFWRYRDVLFALSARDIAVRYNQTFLGVFWITSQPLAQVLVLSIFLGNFVQVPIQGVSYAIYSYAGLIAWNFLSAGISRGSQALLSNSGLLTKTYFPRLLLPASSVILSSIDLFIGCLAFAILAALTGRPVAPSALLSLPLMIVLAICFVLGISLWLNIVLIRFRDLSHALPFLLQLWMFATPVIYSVSTLGEPWKRLIWLNPAVGIIEGFRSSLLGQEWNTTALLLSSTFSLVLLIFGVIFFIRFERGLADTL